MTLEPQVVFNILIAEGEQLVEDMEIPFSLKLMDDSAFFEEEAPYLATSNLKCLYIYFFGNKFPKSA